MDYCRYNRWCSDTSVQHFFWMLSLYDFSILAFVDCDMVFVYFEYRRDQFQLFVHLVRKSFVSLREVFRQCVFRKCVFDDFGIEIHQVFIEFSFTLASFVCRNYHFVHRRFYG